MTIFFTKSPIAVFLWCLIVLSLAFSIFLKVRARKKESFASYS